MLTQFHGHGQTYLDSSVKDGIFAFGVERKPASASGQRELLGFFLVGSLRFHEVDAISQVLRSVAKWGE
ncbi:hypothetical protein GUJ93_ZPchr0010g8969 [Zizania palustris]|uniref:Uncharacterized protein n=1 Tax=Zizania palustris TaxID=103762 RepID=A0A8J5WCP6_ZIZPA|nr:hypothetical protein GUJ93_ZPchr0010g8969 [Zizania palustris]